MRLFYSHQFRFLVFGILILNIGSAFGQAVSINSTGAAPDAQSILDITSSTKGVLFPRLTTAEAATLATSLNAGDDGMFIYDVTAKAYKYWDGNVLAWQEIPNVANTGNTLDAAYDEGGAGAGRVITADNGAVDIQGSGGLLVNGLTGIGTTSPDASYALTAADGNNTVKLASSGLGLRVDVQAVSEDGIHVSHTSTGSSQAYYSVRGQLTNSSTDGYLGYHSTAGGGTTYAVYGSGGDYAGYFDGDINLTGELQVNGSAGTSGQVLLSTGSGSDPVWGTAAGDIESVTAGNALSGGGTSGPVTLDVNANNGLNIDIPNDMVQLGGDLTEATEIELEGFDLTLDLNGSGEFIVQDGGTDHFKVENDGDALFGSDTYFRDTNTGGTDLVSITDAGGGGNDGRIQVFANGTMNHIIHGDGNTIFNDQNLDRDFIVHGSGVNNTFYVDAGTSRIGINNASPAQALHVGGDARITGLADAAGAVVTSDVNGDLNKISFTGSTSDVLLGNGTFAAASTLNDNDWLQTLTSGAPSAVGDWIYTLGNVGINFGASTNPYAALHVQSNAYVGDDNGIGFYNSNSTLHIARTDNTHFLMEDIGNNTAGLSLDAGGLNVTTENGDLDFRTGVTFNGDFSSTGTSRMIVQNGGNVGIGTTTPYAKLNVGDANGASVYLTREDATTNTNDVLGSLLFDSTDDTSPSTTDASAGIRAYASQAHGNSNKGGYMTFFTKDNVANGTAATERMRISANGNIGLGNSNPNYKVQVGAGNGDGVMIGNLNDQLGWNGTGTAPDLSLRFAGYRDVVNDFAGAKIAGIRTNICCSGLSQGMELAFYTQESTATSGGDANLTERLRIGNGGNIGLGTSTPAEKLHVVGNARISGLSASGNVQADGSGNLIISNDIAAGDNDYIQNQNASDQGANFRISGDGQMDQAIATANGNWYMRGGDDHELRDINVANYLGVWGRQNPDRAGIQLGSDNSYIFGDNGNIGVGTIGPAQKLDVAGAVRSTGGHFINYNAPTIYLQDTDHETGMIHMNSHLMYFLSGSGNNSTSWSINGSYWPLTINMQSDVSTFGGQVHFMEGSVGVGTTSPAYNLDVAGNTRTTGDFYGDIHVDDTRDVNDPPTTYNNEVAFDFKRRTTIGVPGSGTYSGNMTIAPWGDDSGDASHQINFNEGGLYWRQGQPNAGSWGSWDRIVTESMGDADYIQNQLGGNQAANFDITGTGEVGRLEFHGEGGNSGNGSYAYTLYQEGGAWTNPYPDLMIRYHTGIKLSAHHNYDGINFYCTNTEGHQSRFNHDGIYLYSGWVRPHGANGLYFQSYGGGWHMTDATWIRSYNSKPVYINVQHRADGGYQVDGNQVIDGDAGWHRTYGNTGWYNGTHGGGWYMTDGTYVRSYNPKAITYGLGSYNTSSYFNGYNYGASTSDGHRFLPNANAPGSTGWGYVGQSNTDWYYMYSDNFTNTSQRSKKRDIQPLDDNMMAYVMKDIENMKPSFYKYKSESDEMIEGFEPKYRPNMHLGVILDETPDYLQDQAFSGVDIYAMGVMALTGVKYQQQQIKELQKANREKMIVGSSEMSSNSHTVQFPEGFCNDNEYPIVNITPTGPNTGFYVSETTDKSFTVVGNTPFTFNWHATRIERVPSTEPTPVIDKALEEQLVVDQSKKDAIQAYWAKDKTKIDASYQEFLEGLKTDDPGQYQRLVEENRLAEDFARTSGKSGGYSVEEMQRRSDENTARRVEEMQKRNIDQATGNNKLSDPTIIELDSDFIDPEIPTKADPDFWKNDPLVNPDLLNKKADHKK